MELGPLDRCKSFNDSISFFLLRFKIKSMSLLQTFRESSSSRILRMVTHEAVVESSYSRTLVIDLRNNLFEFELVNSRAEFEPKFELDQSDN